MIELRWELVAAVISPFFRYICKTPLTLLSFSSVSALSTHTHANIYTCTYIHLEDCEELPYLLQGKEKNLKFKEAHQWDSSVWDHCLQLKVTVEFGFQFFGVCEPSEFFCLIPKKCVGSYDDKYQVPISKIFRFYYVSSLRKSCLISRSSCVPWFWQSLIPW